MSPSSAFALLGFLTVVLLLAYALYPLRLCLYSPARLVSAR